MSAREQAERERDWAEGRAEGTKAVCESLRAQLTTLTLSRDAAIAERDYERGLAKAAGKAAEEAERDRDTAIKRAELAEASANVVRRNLSALRNGER